MDSSEKRCVDLESHTKIEQKKMGRQRLLLSLLFACNDIAPLCKSCISLQMVTYCSMNGVVLRVVSET